MKNRFLAVCLLTAVVPALLFLQSCSKDDTVKQDESYTYTLYSPVYKDKSAVLAAINADANTPIKRAGKLYIKDNFIYLNDVNKGIHIIDNSNPKNPEQVAFLAIPGNLDIAIKGNILYADMYNDLLALDITNLHKAVIKSTINNFFTNRIYIGGYETNTTDKIAIDWNEKDTTVPVYSSYNPGCAGCEFLSANASKSTSGVAGSMAGMVLMNNYLYAISEMHSLGIVDVTNAASPVLDSSFFAGFDLQTIYPFEDKLFLGSAIGMFMYDVSNPRQPVAIGQFQHGRACDPVIADGDYAYVTLHAGTDCGGDQNELDVIGIKNITSSELVKTYNLTNPTGLSKDGDLLFVCDGNEVKLYNAANPANLVLMQQIKSKNPYDAIAADKRLIVVAEDGLYQYDYSNTNYIKLLSFIAAKR